MPNMKIAFIIAAALGCGLVACGDKKKPEPVETAKLAEPGKSVDTDKPSDAAGRDAAGAEASNELDVARYEDEVAVDHAPLKVKASTATAFRSYPKGDMVATLNHDDEVVELSERYGFYRITFPDPKDRSRKLMGWVARFAFEDAPTTKKKLTLPRCVIGTGDPGTAVLVLEDPPRCAHVCKEAAECVASGRKCEARIVVPRSGDFASNPSYTTVCGAKPPDPNARPSLFGVPAPGNGKCPRSYALAPKLGGFCYRSCKKDLDCPDESTCRTFGKVKLCSANLN